jgi:Major Facilitator Superfamily
MTASNRALPAVAMLICGTVLSSTLLIPAVRPFMAVRAPGNEGAAHAFMALNLLGGALAAPFVARLWRAVRSATTLAAGLALLDAALLGWLAVGVDWRVLLVVRTVQGALNLAVLSLLLGAAPCDEGRQSGARYGVLGAAMMMGVALGAPLGTLCMRWGVTGPLLAGALLELSVALLLPLSRLQPARAAAPRSCVELPWLPMAWVFAERMAVGLFVVTFAFHATRCLGATDARVGVAFTTFMVPFVLAVYPAGYVSDRVGTLPVALSGLALYGGGWFALARASSTNMLPVLALLGVSSAAVFAAAMRQAGATTSAEDRIRSMSALNSAGSVGMLLGTALAGVLSAALRGRGAEPHLAHHLLLQLSGLVQLCAACASVAVALLSRRASRLVGS